MDTDKKAPPLVTDAIAVEVTDSEPLLDREKPVAGHVKTVQVVAPVNLPGGYEFLADVNGTATLIRVPEGGVQEGESFSAQVVDNGQSIADDTSTYNPDQHHIPRGHWRDGLFHCLSQGCCHPTFCLALWCQALALGQVMTRMKLDPCGRALGNQTRSWLTAFKVMAFVVASNILLNQLVDVLDAKYAIIELPESAFMNETGSFNESGHYHESGHHHKHDHSNHDHRKSPFWVKLIFAIQQSIGLVIFLYVLGMMIRTRNFIRNRYKIPAREVCGSPGLAEDVCYSLVLPWFTVSQMARHTADYDLYQASCCTETGLLDRAPQVV